MFLGLLGILLSTASLIYTISRNRGIDASSTERRLSALETKVDLWWRGLSVDAARILHSPDPAKAHQDRLLERFMDGTISGDEAVELVGILQDIIDHHDTPSGSRLAASLVLQAIASHYEF